MTTLIAIDPGKHALAWACFADDALVWAGFAEDVSQINVVDRAHSCMLTQVCRRHPPLSGEGMPLVMRVVLEKPQVYEGRARKGDPSDLIDISITGALLAGMLRPVTFETVLPRVWKGQRPKGVDGELTRSRLTPEEISILESVDVAPSKLHNVLDAVGIGLWALGRRPR